MWAVKDPDDANLDRIQIVKGWTKSGQIFEKVYDVAWSGNRKPDPATGKVPAVGNTVDIKKRDLHEPHRRGRAQEGVDAIPSSIPACTPSTTRGSCRFRLRDGPRTTPKKLGVPPPSFAPATVQERAWTSPIWYSPSEEEARRAEKKGMTAAELQSKGAVALDDAQLKALVVGKTFSVRNQVTGDRFEILYGKDGRRLITSVNGKQPDAGAMGDVLHSGELGSPAQYEIGGGRIITTIDMTPFEVRVYKLGDRYVAARSNEFGYANYEVEEIKQ